MHTDILTEVWGAGELINIDCPTVEKQKRFFPPSLRPVIFGN